VLRDISLEVRERELFFLLGPSGCGKTTLLRLLAGFYEPDAGEIRFGAQAMNGLPPHRRNTGMVFQNYALWPHLTVAQNVAYGLEARGVGSAGRRQRVAEALARVHMETLADRSPNELSGGQQQRVALARAIVIRPDVLLLDEPLSNLDARLRLELRDEIRRVHDETRITTIYVTHDQKEALSLADRMAVLRDGAVEQVGAPRDVYRRPANRFVADFLGETNWLPAKVIRAGQGNVACETACGQFTAAAPDSLRAGADVWLGFRPEAVQFGPAGENCLPATITRVTYLGDSEQCVLEAAEGVKLKAAESNPLEPRSAGTSLTIHVRPDNIFVLPR
jgi:iron(III) transport system ATP-binding protein